MPPIPGMGPLNERLTRVQREMPAGLDRALLRGGLLVAAQAKRNVTGGGSSRERLNVRTGRLRGSLAAVLLSPGRVSVGTNVVYAAIHEFGGRTAPHTIVPIRAGALAFRVGGELVLVRKVEHPGSVVPARPYLHPALHSERARVVAGIRQVYAGPLRLGGADA